MKEQVDSCVASVATRRMRDVGIIELARPDSFNSLTPNMVSALSAAVISFEADASIRAVLVCAQGKNFCSGADLQSLNAIRQDERALRNFLSAGHALMRQIECSALPFVAACQGLCLAGGLELMLACDVVFADSTARFGDQHAKFGVIPGLGGSQRLPRIVGQRRAMDLFLSAKWIDASEAERFGLVNRVVTDGLMEAAVAYCDELATRSPEGLALMKRLARQGLDMALPTALAMEVDAASRFLQGADTGEGLRAFSERRAPVFPATASNSPNQESPT
ncbi:enoyl-CoA hydratase/isomerase family protein [Variovorax sp. VNK109]|uniref:enoyl-CoA hydratase/isomerase family protein n=1 Tax=Variovorax sp. VNK109 TaxID=3400919 RepID=UPI003C0FBAD5